MKFIKTLLAAASTAAITACTPPAHPTKTDPYASFNRKMFAVNMALDHLILRPVAKTYVFLTPMPLRLGVRNAYHNIAEPITVGNDLLQGKLSFALADTGRFILNSTFGLFGLFDIASKMGLPPHRNDFGMTLSYYSGQQPTYLVLPFFGPSTFNSTFGRVPDYFMYPTNYLLSSRESLYLQAGNVLSARASFLDADDLLDNSFDPYAFMRDFYLKHREMAIAANKMSYSAYRKAYYQNSEQ